ncbi:hypothetical protein [Brevibacillus brevis]|uniref:hypothetical protein n=1 Tax=Brevibacillus brevis TaxID=1393 RepID=UPI000D106530|nr:hypothetical protein [Brevibacillus brevis]PSJ66051.1 hypothetical protein C7J99_27945 [Brevibacillus brevis]RED20847.1 hypothetical protein DES34_1333 [Brevibacillus brevis]VEF87290.1 Uncharacterised protein [Brevibacillus brevis]VEF87652.1 Uncharacterised protein [Brevibacillus brevis]GEC93861.1 hypothetical protein BBR01nite_61920 [Brevibacillus brevis]
MSRKRRYYREDRRRPEYLEEEDWEDDADDHADVERSVRKTSWGLLAVLSFGVLLSIAQALYVPSGPLPAGDAYRVVSVSRGRLQAEEIGTGRVVSLDDQKLVRAALDGSIKRGDVIHR